MVSEIPGTLTANQVPGNFDSKFFDIPGLVADYNVIWLDDDSAIEYDCTVDVGVTNYCVHIMSRRPTLNADKVQAMINYAGKKKKNISIVTCELLRFIIWNFVQRAWV